MVAAARSAPGVVLAGLMTHFATADEPDDEGFFEQQLQAFTSWAAPLKREQPQLIVHAANSAAVLRAARGALRHGPLRDLDLRHGPLRRGRRSRASSSRCSSCPPTWPRSSPAGRGRAPATGARFRARGDTAIALLPIGYGDGWRRALSNNAEVLIAGRRYPLAGHREHGQHHGGGRRDAPRRRAARRAGGADRRRRERADQRRGGRPAPRDDQLRGHLRAHQARAEDLPPRRRARSPSRPTDEPRAALPAGASPVELARRALAGREAWLVGGATRDRLLGRASADVDVVARRATCEQAARALARAASRAACFELSSDHRCLAGGQHRARLAGRLRAAARADARAGPARCATSPSTRSPSRSPGASRSTRSGASRTFAPGACGRPPRAPSSKTRCGSAPGAGGASSSTSSPSPRRSRSRARGRAAAARMCRPSACSRSCAGSSPRPQARRGVELLADIGAAAVVLPELEQLRGVAAEPLPPRRRVRAHARGARRVDALAPRRCRRRCGRGRRRG